MGRPPQSGPLTITGPTELTISSGESTVSAQYVASKSGNNLSWDVVVSDDGGLAPDQYFVFIDQQGLLTIEIYPDVVIPEGGITISLEVRAQIGNGSGSGNSASLGVDVFIEEGVIPCFVAGTRISTARGEVPVEELLVGDFVLNSEGWSNPIVWIGSRKLSEAELALAPHLRPVKIRRDAFGAGRPYVDLFVSPQHRIVLDGWKVEVLFGVAEVFAHASHLIDNELILETLPCDEVHYYHFVLERHEVVVSEGLKTESMLPAGMALKSVQPEARAELLEILPESVARTSIDPTQAALRVLTKAEARLYSSA